MYDVIYATRLTEAIHWLDRMHATIDLGEDEITITIGDHRSTYQRRFFELTELVAHLQVEMAKANVPA